MSSLFVVILRSRAFVGAGSHTSCGCGFNEGASKLY